MNSQAPPSEGPIICYNCERKYCYIGTDPHPGQCPHCGEQAVSPAGTLESLSSRIVLVDDRPQVKVVAADTTDRLFLYRFSVTRSCTTCVEILIEDTYSLKRDEWPDELLPASIWRTAEGYGYQRCAETTDPK